MISTETLLDYFNQHLEIERFNDYGPNGLQVEGSTQLSKVAFAVSATLESIEQSVAFGAQALVVHHGLLWRSSFPSPLIGIKAKRLQLLLQNQINLIAYHLPLDAHLEWGNAAGLAKGLGANLVKPFGEMNKAPVGVMANFSVAQEKNSLEKKLIQLLGRQVISSSTVNSTVTTNKISQLAIVTGAGADFWPISHALKADGFLTGEISIQHWHEANENNFQLFAGGHHATERFGVQALEKECNRRWPQIQTAFFDSENPV